MDIQVKNIRVTERLSHDSLAFSANLYIDDHPVGILTNDGYGGVTNCQALDKRSELLIEEAVKWIGSLPGKPGFEEASDRTAGADQQKFSYHLEDMVVRWWNGKEALKFQKKAEKAMVTGILFGVPGRSFRVLKYRQPIVTLMRTDMGVEQLRMDIHSKVLPLLTEEKKILNTNVPAKIIELLEVPLGNWVDCAEHE